MRLSPPLELDRNGPRFSPPRAGGIVVPPYLPTDEAEVFGFLHPGIDGGLIEQVNGDLFALAGDVEIDPDGAGPGLAAYVFPGGAADRLSSAAFGARIGGRAEITVFQVGFDAVTGTQVVWELDGSIALAAPGVGVAVAEGAGRDLEIFGRGVGSAGDGISYITPLGLAAWTAVAIGISCAATSMGAWFFSGGVESAAVEFHAGNTGSPLPGGKALYIGGGSDGSLSYAGKLGPIVFVDGLATGALRDRIMAYLATWEGG